MENKVSNKEMVTIRFWDQSKGDFDSTQITEEKYHLFFSRLFVDLISRMTLINYDTDIKSETVKIVLNILLYHAGKHSVQSVEYWKRRAMNECETAMTQIKPVSWNDKDQSLRYACHCAWRSLYPVQFWKSLNAYGLMRSFDKTGRGDKLDGIKNEEKEAERFCMELLNEIIYE